MKRKLALIGLCTLAAALLMGAGLPNETPGAEDSAAVQTVQAEAGANPLALAAEAEQQALLRARMSLEQNMTIDGETAPAEVALTMSGGVPYVSLAGMSGALDSSAAASWDAKSATEKVTTSLMTVTAKVGRLYVEANGRYLYLPGGVQMRNGEVSLPLSMVAKIFDARLDWDAGQGKAALTRGSGAIQPGSSYYDQNDLFWLSRVIYRESGNQPLEGQIAVGNVVLNRVASPLFPNTVQGVLAQKNQFSTYASGALKKTKPSAESTIAAKLALDGAVVEKTKGAMWFDSAATSWAARHKTYMATIGGHKFYK